MLSYCSPSPHAGAARRSPSTMEQMLGGDSPFGPGGPGGAHPGLGPLVPAGYNPYTGHFSLPPNGYNSSFSPEYSMVPHSMTSPQPGAGGAIGTMAFTIDGLLTSQAHTPTSQSGPCGGPPCKPGSGRCRHHFPCMHGGLYFLSFVLP